MTRRIAAACAGGAVADGHLVSQRHHQGFTVDSRKTYIQHMRLTSRCVTIDEMFHIFKGPQQFRSCLFCSRSTLLPFQSREPSGFAKAHCQAQPALFPVANPVPAPRRKAVVLPVASEFRAYERTRLRFPEARKSCGR